MNPVHRRCSMFSMFRKWQRMITTIQHIVLISVLSILLYLTSCTKYSQSVSVYKSLAYSTYVVRLDSNLGKILHIEKVRLWRNQALSVAGRLYHNQQPIWFSYWKIPNYPLLRIWFVEDCQSRRSKSTKPNWTNHFLLHEGGPSQVLTTFNFY